MSKAYFVTIEGIEGAGKSTAIIFVRKFLEANKIPHVVTREPGGTQIGAAIRDLLLKHHEEQICSDTELLLFFASRAQSVTHLIKPALQEDKWVICDRFTDASYAYQGGGRGIPMQRIQILEEWVHPDLQPDLTLLLDVPVNLGLQRIGARDVKDRIEQEKVEFFERVRRVYLERAKQFPQRFKIIDASASLLQVEKQIVEILNSLVNSYSAT
jgi:dTMP kinase